MQWHEIMPFDDLWIGEMLGVEVEGVKVLLLNVEDEVRAYLDRCRSWDSLGRPGGTGLCGQEP